MHSVFLLKRKIKMKRKAIVKNIDPQFLHKTVQKTVGHTTDFSPSVLYIAAGALINLDNEVLLCTRPEGKDYAGMWEFPGGKVENTERPEQTLSRELMEELGLEVSVKDMTPLSFASHVHEITGKNMLMYLFRIRAWQGKMEAREGQTFSWVPLHRLPTYIDMMPPIDRPLAQMLVKLS